MAENSEVSGEVTVAKKKRGPGRPFQPGQSGNPGGRPAVLRDFREKCRRFMEEEGWDLLISIARDPKAKDRRYAIELLANYAYGKPTQPISGDDEMPALRIVVIGEHVPDTDTAESR